MSVPTFECSCCFDTVELNHAVTCQSGHVACVTCIERALKNAIEENMPFHCFTSTVPCQAEFSHIAIMRAVQDEGLKQAYDTILANRSRVHLDNTWSCSLCDNTVTVEGIDISTYDRIKCNECKKTVCNQCNKEAHDGHCDEERRREEEATERFIFKCRCGNKIFRGDGCNHMQCRVCRLHFCWICKAHLGRDFGLHFYDASVPARHRPPMASCPRWGERPENQVFAENTTSSNHRIRRRVNVDEEPSEPTVLDLSTISLDPCRPPADTSSTQQPLSQEPVAAPHLSARSRRIRKVPCRGVTRKGTPCSFGSASGYCKRHLGQAHAPLPQLNLDDDVLALLGL